MTDNRNTQMDTEDGTEVPGLQHHRFQEDFPDAAEMDNGKQLPSTVGPEKGPQHLETSEEGGSELGTQEQGSPARPRKQLSSWGAQEGTGELGAGQDQAQPGSKLRVLPSRPHATPEGLQLPGTKTKEQQGTPCKPQTEQDQRLESSQDPECPSPGQQAASGLDTMHLTESCCALDSGVQPPGDDPRGEAGDPHIRPREALPEPNAAGSEGSSQGATHPKPMATAEEKTATTLLPPTLRPKAPREGGEAAGTQPAPRPLPLTEVRDIRGRREPGHAQEAESPGNSRPGFMKCLLEAEEEGAAHRRARKSPRPLPPGPTSVPMSHAAPLTLPQPPAPGPPTTPSAAEPDRLLWAPIPDGWRRKELPQSPEWSPSCARPWRELEEPGLLRLCQGWEEQAEEHLTLKQEEAFRSYFEIFNGPGEVDAQSLKNILVLVGFSLTPGQVEEALMSADVDGDGHVDFKDFLAVMTDTRRFFCSMEQKAVTNMAPPNPHTLLFEILSLLVEMLALPETVLEEITDYYRKKLKEGTHKAQEMASATGQLRSQKQVASNLQQAGCLEVPERRALSIPSRLKQNASDLQSPYAQVPCIPLCPRLNKKMVHQKQGSHNRLDQCAPASLSPSTRNLFQSGPQGSREHSFKGGKWLSSVSTRTH